MPRKKKADAKEIAKMREVEAYTHDDKQRTNNPPAGMARYDKEKEHFKTYTYDPNLDPTLQWAGKEEGLSFDVPTSSIHIHETIRPHQIIDKVMEEYEDVDDTGFKGQMSLFEPNTPAERMRKRREAIEFYKHGVDWTNRMIAGDSLVIMNSLLEKEGMAGQVQMVYIDPPYGIKYGSNFQPFVNKRDVKDKKDEDLSQEPEMIKAFRDTWELGIHSYLSYLRDRLLLARELLSESGSVFVQISDENVHHVRELLDEVFGVENFVVEIKFQKTGSLSSNLIAGTTDYIIWYAKKRSRIKYRPLFLKRKQGDPSLDRYDQIELKDGSSIGLSIKQRAGEEPLPDGRRFRLTTLLSDGETISSDQEVLFQGERFFPRHGKHWKTSVDGIQNLIKKNRVIKAGSSIWYKRYVDDFPVIPMNDRWESLQIGIELTYVVQTSPAVIQRCILLSTDPGDLVLDITCGSGTTAFVAEQWGRRWITCDTSRVAIALAKQRLMTATYDYYKLAYEEQGISGGLIYQTVPHITLKSIANKEAPEKEVLYDQPEIDKSKIRISGPFTVEALPAPVVKSLDEEIDPDEDYSAKQTDWRDQLLATGILGRGGAKIEFSRVESLSGTHYLQAEAETKEETPRRAVICFAGETKPLDARMVELAFDEAEKMRPAPALIIFAAFQFDPEAAKQIEEITWPNVTLLKAQMNTDLMTQDLKKKRSSDQSFWLVGQPDVELIRDKRSNQIYKVKVNGFDYYDVKKGDVTSGTASNIAMWMLDTSYDGMVVNPQQVFFPMGGKSGGWSKLAKTLRTEINPEKIEQYAGNESLWFKAPPRTKIAVKIIDDRGIESLKVIQIEEP
ncbi:MAG: site-specific DNA-methyltransferase [Lachnospiraceae bacterium]|nr:site-specific DNA-methyltransferase [Lachnospiraceae bacterium]